jgi:hypothetical protein
MPEWWTYSLSDFLLFSPRTYYRLVERYNLATWPVHLLTLALGMVIAALLRRPTPGHSRVVAAVLVVLWAWVGWAFVVTRYATINWAASWLAWLFAAEVLLLGWMGVLTGRLRFEVGREARSRVGAGLFAGSLAVYPLLAPALGRGWSQAETFGVMPDPTVLGTMGLLLMAQGSTGARRLALVAPVVWCLLSGATLLAMHSPEAWIVLAAAVLAPALPAILRSRRAGRPETGERRAAR